jgi:hypothetical protein
MYLETLEFQSASFPAPWQRGCSIHAVLYIGKILDKLHMLKVSESSRGIPFILASNLFVAS